MTFVNPYTFVPLATAGPERSMPHGHHGTPGLLTAQLNVTIIAEAPLLVRGFGTDDVPALPARPGPDGEETIIPGSALHGAIRSLYETLTDSCLRVFHDGFVPCYRQQADGRRVGRLRLAVVTDAPAAGKGQPQPPPTVRLCAPGDPRRHRLGQDLLTTLQPRSGDRMAVTVPDDENEPLEAMPDPDGDWVVFISDANAREPKHKYKAAVRELTDEYRTVPEHAWSTFLAVVETANDLRTARLRMIPETERFIDVIHKYKPPGGTVRPQHVGQRALARRTVQVGDPLWVSLDTAGEIDEVRLAQIWRERGAGSAERGTGSAGRRAGAFVPCTDPGALCPACRLFGSADVTGPADGATEQRSYRGHVRFSDAVATASVQPREVRLPPLGQPRPGAGQFYLQNPPQVVGSADAPVPLRQWGSSADRPRERRIRGRKFYWHTVPEQPTLPPRGVARPGHDGSEMSTRAVLFPAGTRFTATITAVDVDPEQLGGLLAALDPAAVLDQDDALVHLGGGRPLGYGSCRIKIADTSRAWVSASRYGRAGSDTDLLAEGRDAFAARRGRHEATWRALSAVLSRARVAGENVWYPPGAGAPGDDTYDEGFEFWKQSAGKRLKSPDHDPMAAWGLPLTVLPEPTTADQTLQRVIEATSVRLPNQSGDRA